MSYVYARTLCAYCGDKYIYPPAPHLEECDDGNMVSGDGCSSTCQIESLFTCIPANQDILGPSVCSFECMSAWNVWTTDNSTAWQSWKDCDDGNSVEDDGCTSLCNINTGWICENGTATTPDTCTEICGDGYDYHTYPCDDGNLDDGDGCDANCQVETGWTCADGNIPFPDICTYACTTRVEDLGIFACVDSNLSPNDGCNGQCEVEKGWECTGGDPVTIDSCFEVCGDSYNL